MRINNIIYEQQISDTTVAQIDEVGDGMYVFKLVKDNKKLLLSCFVREEGLFDCSIHAMTKECCDITIKDIAKFRPLFRFLEFKRGFFKRSIDGAIHTINFKVRHG